MDLYLARKTIKVRALPSPIATSTKLYCMKRTRARYFLCHIQTLWCRSVHDDYRSERIRPLTILPTFKHDTNAMCSRLALFRSMGIPCAVKLPQCQVIHLLLHAMHACQFKISERFTSIPACLVPNTSWCRYKPDEISITENGYTVKGEDNMSIDEALNDTARIKYLKGYLDAATEAFYYDKVCHLHAIRERAPLYVSKSF